MNQPSSVPFNHPPPAWDTAQTLTAYPNDVHTNPAVVEVIGYVSGGILAVCLIPQIHHVWHTRSATDISYWWSLLNFLGTAGSLVYLALINAVAGWASCAVEMVLLAVLVGLKWWCERSARRAAGDAVVGSGDLDGETVSVHSSYTAASVKCAGSVMYVTDRGDGVMVDVMVEDLEAARAL
ncbi:hypothetical protein GGF32_001183 [Allomyces javanicus]|nr:hypothetical protein GGF32_001183 [Allomyces javanicus]